MECNNPWIKNITKENLPNEDLKIIAEILGLGVAIKMMCELPGMNIAIPKNATLKAKIQYIKQNYDGSKKSRYDLAKACGLSENYIYRIAKSRGGVK